MEKHYALYARVSTDDQTVDPQLLDLREQTQRWGWSPVEIYTDVGISGAKTSRPGLDRLLQAARKGRVLGVTAAKLDRLGRSLQHLVMLLDELSRLGVPVVIPSQNIDTRITNPAGRLQVAILAAVAEFERAIITERVHAGIAAAKAKGKHCGRPPLGQEVLEKARPIVAAGTTVAALATSLGVSTGKAFAIRKQLLAEFTSPIGPVC